MVFVRLAIGSPRPIPRALVVKNGENRRVISSSGIPFRLIAIFIPLIVGLMTGMTIAPIAIAFPILIPLFRKDPDFFNYMMLAFASGIAGDLLSPFHLCLVLTKNYFHADWKGIFRLLWIPVALLLGVALLMTYIR